MIGARQRRIYDYIQLKNEATNAELKEICGNVSNMTLWRDLKMLEDSGMISRVRGGAQALRTSSAGPDSDEGIYSKRAKENIAAKRAIAAAALPLLTPGRSIFMDAGSTLMSLAQIMPDNGCTILTVGINIAMEVCRRTSCTVICSGGRIDANTLSCYGPETESFLDNLNIDLFLMACSSYTLSSGFTCGSKMYGDFRRKVIGKSAYTALLMDHSKIGRRLPYSFASLADIDKIITDIPLPEDIAAEARRNNVEVLIASMDGMKDAADSRGLEAKRR